ncbi:MAG: hypothetical protein ABIJ50_07410 [Pseudomonadota bacterium]
MSPMTKSPSEQTIAEIFSLAGISINGSRPWDIQVYNPEFYDHTLCGGSVALGESYMAEWWDCLSLDQFFFRVLRHDLDLKLKTSRSALLCSIKATLSNCQNKRKAG